jgi:signal transduction histidine kinase/ActR/RegA family two-component response regulator
MDDPLGAPIEERVLLLAPTKRDAAAAGPLFAAAGITLTPCRDIAEVCNEIERGAAVAVVPDEAILGDRQGRLARLLRAQPAWSDLPLIVLVSPQQTRAAAQELEAVGHMTLVRRPIEIQSLASTLRAALRDRRRQYQIRAEIAERERQAKALRDADRQKDEFLAMLAHELRNPLAAVNNAVTVLKLSPNEEARAWAADVVERQVRQLVRLIDDLLDVSRITSGKIRLRKDHVDAGAILDHAIESARPLIDERRHTLSVAIEHGTLPLHADATRVEQIVLNLLTNAAKYTEPGGRIWLGAALEADRVVITVRDNGIGIAPERLPDMFRLFAQGDRSLARSEGGLGIGLTIVQSLAELHGGRVDARSEGAGRGSEFVVTLPAARASSESPAAAPRGPLAAGPGARVLVVDDNVDTARGTVRLLRLLGNDARAVHDGPSALEAAGAFRPRFILLDIGLPGMHGYDVAAALRADPRHKETVIIAVSGYGQDEDRRRSRAAGCDHHLAKPVDFESLAALLGQPHADARTDAGTSAGRTEACDATRRTTMDPRAASSTDPRGRNAAAAQCVDDDLGTWPGTRPRRDRRPGIT